MESRKIRKIDLINSIYEKTGFDKQDIQTVADRLFEEVSKALENGSTIELRGFGTFEPRLRKGREVARNPKTGELCRGVPHYVAVFRAGRELKQNMLKINSNLDMSAN
ncbi:MAG: HU family DNA-binding protein [Treponema sp.]|jgi:integration host factor subunit beta|nr:HU family DNA-binding protein [Treponema sp.]